MVLAVSELADGPAFAGWRDGLLVGDVESDQTLTGCPQCGVVAVGHGRRVQVLHDAPCLGRPVRVRWFKRIWRCPEPACGRRTWTEGHDFAATRAKLTARADRLGGRCVAP